MTSQIYKIIVADDHQIFRDGIKLVLSLNKTFIVISEASDGFELLEKARKFKPDLILMDISMQGIGGIDAAKIILEELPDTKVLFLTMHDDLSTYQDAMNTGAHGYMLKKSGKEILETAILKILSGGLFSLDENYI